MDKLIGQKIKVIRLMTKKEAEFEGWEDNPMHSLPVVLVLENGVRLYPSRDEEGNGGGALFGRKGTASFYVFPTCLNKEEA